MKASESYITYIIMIYFELMKTHNDSSSDHQPSNSILHQHHQPLILVLVSRLRPMLSTVDQIYSVKSNTVLAFDFHSNFVINIDSLLAMASTLIRFDFLVLLSTLN